MLLARGLERYPLTPAQPDGQKTSSGAAPDGHGA